MIEINETDYNDLIKRLNYLESRVSWLEHLLEEKQLDHYYDDIYTISTQACNITEEMKKWK